MKIPIIHENWDAGAARYSRDLERGQPVFADADYLCLAYNLTAENRHMIDAEVLPRTKQTAFSRKDWPT